MPSRGVHVGQVRVAMAMEYTDEHRLVVVLAVDRLSGIVDVCLVSSETDYAAANDVLVGREETGADFDLLVETDLPGSLWVHQLDVPVGEVPAGLTEALCTACRGAGPQSAGISASRSGLPARDDRDPRWGWKLGELAVLRSLAEDCTRELLTDSRRPALLDTAAVRRLVTNLDSYDSLSSLAELSEAADEARAFVPLDSVERLVEQMSGMHSMASFGPDVATVVDDLLLRRAMRAGHAGAASADAVLSAQRRGQEAFDADLARAAAALAGGEIGLVDLLTDLDEWPESEDEGWTAPYVQTAEGHLVSLRFTSPSDYAPPPTGTDATAAEMTATAAN